MQRQNYSSSKSLAHRAPLVTNTQWSQKWDQIRVSAKVKTHNQKQVNDCKKPRNTLKTRATKLEVTIIGKWGLWVAGVSHVDPLLLELGGQIFSGLRRHGGGRRWFCYNASSSSSSNVTAARWSWQLKGRRKRATSRVERGPSLAGCSSAPSDTLFSTVGSWPYPHLVFKTAWDFGSRTPRPVLSKNPYFLVGF